MVGGGSGNFLVERQIINMIYLHTYSGLTSRCNTLSQTYWLAKKYNEKLVIFWEISWDCNISYKDIFDERQFNDIEYKVLEYNTFFKTKYGEMAGILIQRMIRAVFYCLIKATGGRTVDYAPPAGMSWLGEDMKKRVLKCGKKVMSTLQQKRNIFISAFNGLSIDEIDMGSCQRKIIFKQTFVRKAERMMKRETMWIGVHIRRTDHRLATEHSTLDAFVKKMKEMEKIYPLACFWLATDDKEVEMRIKGIFKDRVSVLGGKHWGRNTRKAMESAVLDCLCLSKCDVILGSFGSAFSRFAAHYGNKELITIDKLE